MENANISRSVQVSAPGRMVELFDIDFTPINPLAGEAHFYPTKKEDGGLGMINWRGNQYLPLPISLSGVSVSGRGALPRPVIRASNVLGTMTTVLKTFGSIGGAILTRWVTFAQYLDDGDSPDIDAHLPVDVWVLDRVLSHNKLEISVECRSLLDFSRQRLPRRQMLRTFCNHTYRQWDEDLGNFDYTRASCPYMGSVYLNELDQATTAPFDKCSKKLTGGCRGRFGTQALPYRGFPTMGRFG